MAVRPSGLHLRDLLLRLVRNEQLLLLVVAAVAGAAAAYAAIGFRELVRLVAWAAYGIGGGDPAAAARGLPWWILIAVPAAGGLVLGLLTRFVLPGPLPQGVADVIEACALRNGHMPLKSGLAAAFLSASSIGVGASVGREGPIVHLGATLASWFAKRLHLGPSLARTLLGCGVSGAIAAAFNAPIAGVFFALEVVVGHYGLGAFSPVVIASLVGTVVTRVHIGDEPAFGLLPHVVASFWEVPAFLLLGVVSAAVAMALMWAIGIVQRLHDRLRVPSWLQPALAGLVLGIMALGFPEILGVGYEVTTRALYGEFALESFLLLAVVKTAATALCLGSRFGGGIFSPSLAIGALTGGAFGLVAGSLFPDLASGAGVYATLGMGAVAAATLGAPVSTVIMIFELTTDYGITFALMASVAVATLLTRQLYGHSFFTWQLACRGVDVEGHRELALLRTRRVRDVMRDDHVEVPRSAPLEEVKRRFHERHGPIFVVEEDGTLYGAITLEDLVEAEFAPGDGERPRAERLARRLPVVLFPQEDLAAAFRRCHTYQLEHVPVVRSARDFHLVGEVRMRDLIEAYNRALLEARAQEQGRC